MRPEEENKNGISGKRIRKFRFKLKINLFKDEFAETFGVVEGVALVPQEPAAVAGPVGAFEHVGVPDLSGKIGRNAGSSCKHLDRDLQTQIPGERSGEFAFEVAGKRGETLDAL